MTKYFELKGLLEKEANQKLKEDGYNELPFSSDHRILKQQTLKCYRMLQMEI